MRVSSGLELSSTLELVLLLEGKMPALSLFVRPDGGGGIGGDRSAADRNNSWGHFEEESFEDR